MSRITLHMIAEASGVSSSTVSRALNGSNLIDAPVVERIQQQAKKMGYKRRVIRRNVSRAILNVKLVLPKSHRSGNPLFYDLPALVEGIREGAAPCRVQLVMETVDTQWKAFPHKKGGNIDAFIFAFCLPSKATQRELDERGVPWITLNRSPAGAHSITVDHEQTMTSLMQYLADTYPDIRPTYLESSAIVEVSVGRRKGFQAACRERGLKGHHLTLPTSTDWPATLLRPLLRRGDNTLVCFNDIIALAVLQRVHSLGKRIPDDVRITGIDASPVASIAYPSLTTVRLPFSSFGTEAGAWLIQSVIEQQTQRHKIQLQGELIIGESA